MVSKKRRTGAFLNPKGEGCSEVVETRSTPAKFVDDVVYRLYFKGLVSDEIAVAEGSKRTATAGFGVAICDQTDELLFEIKEPMNDTEISCKEVEIRALVCGLSESLDLGIRNVVVYCEDYEIYQNISGICNPKEKRVIQLLIEEVERLRKQFASTKATLVDRNDTKFAFKLAREAISSQTSSDDVKATDGEICVICLEETEAKNMFLFDKCLHRHCFSCVKQFVEVKLCNGAVPTCLGCNLELTLESCNNVLTPKLIELWKHKMKEDSIPVAERIYCPYPNCSMLMSKAEISGSDQSNARTCVKCSGLFCIECKVPSHSDLSCADYKKLHPEPLVDEMKLNSLAKDQNWRQCVKCRHLIELNQGCNHMTCRCGYQFCYKCGVKWKKGRVTCPTVCSRTDNDGGGDDDEDNYEDDEIGGYYDNLYADGDEEFDDDDDDYNVADDVENYYQLY